MADQGGTEPSNRESQDAFAEATASIIPAVTPLPNPRTAAPAALPVPVDPSTTADVLAAWLNQLNDGSSRYVHPKPVSFYDNKTKANWRTALPDSADRESIANLWKAAKGSVSTWLIFVSTWTGTWVADKDWDKQAWHCWGVAFIKNAKTAQGTQPNGKHMLIWDCDAIITPNLANKKPVDQLQGMQRRFFEFANKMTLIDSVWLGGGLSQGQGKCLNSTARWIQDMAARNDAPWDAQMIAQVQQDGFQRLRH